MRDSTSLASTPPKYPCKTALLPGLPLLRGMNDTRSGRDITSHIKRSATFPIWPRLHNLGQFESVKRVIGHQHTAYSVTLVLGFPSVALFAVSQYRKPDKSECPVDAQRQLFDALSRFLLGLISLYFTVLPFVRDKTLHLRNRSLYWAIGLFSVLASVVAVSTSVAAPKISTIASFISDVVPVYNSFFLAESVEHRLKHGTEKDSDSDDG